MCEIINVQKINNQFIVDCTPCKEDFTNAKLLQIINKHKQVYTTKEFKVEKTRWCFSKGGSPWIVLQNIPDDFVDKGNEIIFR